ncbi:hypothetical protein [Nannocystis pusilla]|uniref:hypothetical protein n=1 Tax=Nannocystis pusilla TaxID=889268 RepID=UPI003B7932BE
MTSCGSTQSSWDDFGPVGAFVLKNILPGGGGSDVRPSPCSPEDAISRRPGSDCHSHARDPPCEKTRLPGISWFWTKSSCPHKSLRHHGPRVDSPARAGPEPTDQTTRMRSSIPALLALNFSLAAACDDDLAAHDSNDWADDAVSFRDCIPRMHHQLAVRR